MKNIRYINAGAGSGKTHTLSHLLSDSLLGRKGRTKIDSSQVILTTFTKAAAAEFREKSRAALIEAGCPDIAAELEAAAIGTVHSVCEQFVRKYWCSLGLSPQMKVISDEDRDFYVNRSIARLARPDDIPVFNDFCRSFNISTLKDNYPVLDFEFWKDSVKSVIDKMTTYNIVNLGESEKQSKAEIDAIYDGSSPDAKDIDFFLSTVKYLFELNRLNKDGSEKATVVDLIDEVDRMNKEITSVSTIYGIYKWIAEDPRKLAGNVAYRRDFEKVKPGFLDVFLYKLESWMVAAEFGDKIKGIVGRVFRIAGEWKKKYEKYKADNQILDFDDLEQYFLKLLTDPKFTAERDEIKVSFKLLMVDEFQDTNPVQLQIFDALSDLIAEGGGETFWVGDPKQSIYGFRGSDTSLITSVTSAFVPEDRDPNATLLKKDPLKKNWRSRPELVDIANEVFTAAFSGELAKEDVELPEKARPYDELDAPYLLHWESDNIRGKNVRLGELANKIFNILYVDRWDVIRKKRDDETDEEYQHSKKVKIEPKDVAVLCRSRSDVKNVVNAFRNAGLPVSATEPDIMDWAEIQLVLALLRFVVDNGDMGARADIAHLLDERPVDEILGGRFDYLYNGEIPEPDEWMSSEKTFKILKKISERIAGLSVSDILSQIILELGLYEFAQKWDYAEARRQNLGLIQRLASQYEEHCVQLGLCSSVVGFVDYVSNYDSEIRNEDTTSNTVKVMTYHKSKGLEWNLVCLYSLDKNVADEDSVAKKEFSGVATGINSSGERYINYFPSVFGSLNTLPDPIMRRIKHSKIYVESYKRVISEERRLLYVGFTRARDYLVTLSKKKSVMRWIADCGAGPGVGGSDSSVWSNGVDAYEDISGCTAGQVVPVAQSDPVNVGKWGIEEEAETAPKYVNPSKIKKDTSEVKLTEVFSGAGMKENIKEEDKCGTCIHNIFAAYDPDLTREENVAMAQRIISGLGLDSQLPDAGSVIDSVAQFYGYLKINFPGDNVALKETPFIFEVNADQASALGLEAGQVIRGEIDLVWLTDKVNKKCVLVDYKSYHGSRDINSTDPKIRDHYSGYASQLSAYKAALEAGGYTVDEVMIYYHVQGRAVRFEF